MFSTNWSTNGIPYTSSNPCQQTCTRADTNANISILSLDGAIYTNGFQLKQAITQPYSIIGADIVYTLDNSEMKISLLDGLTSIQDVIINTTRELSKFGINYKVSCPSYNTNRNTYIVSLMYKSKLVANEAILKFQQTQLSSNSSENLMGIAQIRLWANCVLNCEVCSDDLTCQKCFPGFKIKSLPSGQRVCEQTFNACMANCDTCNNSIDNSVSVCNSCIFGYYSTGSICKQLQPCPINQKYDYTTSTCVNYTNKCFIQTSYKTNTWTSCDGLVDPGNYRCGVGLHILIYDWQNYKLAKCGCTDSKCEKCLDSQDKCYECYQGYSISGAQTKCQFNGSCPANFYFDANTSTCEPICSSNCDFCTDTKCIYCKRDKSYYITSSNLKNCAECNLPSCKTCNGSGQCIECTGTGLSISPDKSKCEACQVNSCQTCSTSNSNVCSTCVKNYVNKISSCVCKQYESCSTCDAADGNICLGCYTGYTYDNALKKCNCTLQGCNSCKDKDGGKCKPTSCNSGYTFDPVSETCICSVQNCAVCNNTNGSICTTCVNGYKAVSSSICQCDSVNCSTCSSSDGKKCSLCNSGYSLNISTSLCESNIPFCQTNNTTDVTKCDSCKTYYKTNNTKDQCIPIIDDCLTIDVNNKCTQCVSGYIYDNGQNKCNCSVQYCSVCNELNGNTCDTCNTYYTQEDNTNQKCIPQIYQCSSIDSNNKCQSCNNNYLLDTVNNKCNCQVKFCNQCFSNNGLKCQICSNLYYNQENDSKCLPNIGNCLEVDAQNKCTKCELNFKYISTTNTCECNVKYCGQCDLKDGNICITCKSYYNKDIDSKSCISTIINCDIIDSFGKCSQCISGYSLNSQQNKCECSVQNCDQCNLIDGSKCDQCKVDYLKLFQETRCIKQIDNCLFYNQDGTCKTCQSDYLYNSSNNTCNCDVDFCSSCSSSSGLICDSCLPYYNLQLDKKSCVPSIQSCNIINSSGTCEVCLSGYQLNTVNNSCECGVENCQQCSESLGSICYQCNTGYVSNSSNTICQSSTENCIQFDQSTSKCIKCQMGYIIDASNHICVCSAQNCISCESNDGSLCTNCSNNYEKINGQCNCKVQNCSSCELGDGLLCKQCQNGYQLSPEDKQCYLNCASGQVFNPKLSSCEQCQVENCLSCKQFNSQTCEQCQTGYRLENEQKCTLIKTCDVLKCQKCQEADNTKCAVCEAGFILNINFICEKIIENNFSVTQQVTDEGYKIIIQFDDKIVVSENKLDQVIDMVIDKFDKYKVISYSNLNNIKIEAYLLVNDNCKQNTLSVTIKDDQFVKVNNLKKKKDEIALKEYVKLSKEEKQQAQAIKDTANSIQSSLLTSMLPIAILGNFYVLFNTIDYTTFLYFLLFVNVRHPQNILNFCSIFQNFQMAFIPNLFNLYFIDTGYVQNYTPKKYIEQQVDAYFFNQGGQSLVIVIAIMTIYFCLKVLISFDLPFKSYLQSKLESGWEYCGFIDLYGFVQVYVFLGVLLQFYSFEFTESISFLNYSLFSMCFIASILIPICIAIFLHKDQDLTQPKIQKQFASIIGGLRVAKPEIISNYRAHSKRIYYQLHYIKYNTIILTIRKLLFCIFIVFLHDYPYIQLTLISTLNSFIAFYYLYLWPHEAGYENCRNALSEFLLISMQIVIGLLVKDNQDQIESERFLYGWIFVGLAAFLIFIHVITVFLDFARLIFRILSFTYLLVKVWYITIKNHINGKKNTIYPSDDNSHKKIKRKKDSPNSQILSSHLKTQGINLDQTINSSRLQNVIRNIHKKHSSGIKNHKLRHILTANNAFANQIPQLTKYPSRKESNNNSYEHQKDDSSSNFYSSGAFSATAAVTKPKIVAFQPNTTNKEDNQMLKSNFYQIYSPSANISSFDFNPSIKGSLIEQQLSIRGSTILQKSEKFNSPNNSFKEDEDETINEKINL